MTPFLHYKRQFLFALVFCCVQAASLNHADAQELDKEVYVIRAYEPSLANANKINFLPETEDITTATPEFNYSISHRPIPVTMELNPINPARMVAVTLPKIYNSWLKVGLGNHMTPLVAFNISNVRSKDFAFGAYLYHKSSHSNITLDNDDRVPGGYAKNNVNLYGKRTYNKAALSGNLLFEHHGFNYYGYNIYLFPSDPLPEMERDSIRQRTYLMDFNARLESTHENTYDMNYNGEFSVNYFFDRDNNREAMISTKAGVSKYFGELQGGIGFEVDYFNLNARQDTSSNTLVRVNPWIGKNSEDWRFVLGLQTVYDFSDISRFYLYPAVKLEITVVENVLVPFLGLSGSLKANNYQQLTKENAFITPGLRLKNTSTSLVAYGGIKGSISNAVRFRFDVNYSVNKNMHFFVNDTLLPLHNQFTAEYDDVDIIAYHGQLAVKPMASLEFLLEGNYYDYSMLNLEKPWYKPLYELDFSVLYNIRNRVTLDGEMILLGPRWMKIKMPYEEVVQKIEPAADFNLKVSYQYSKLLSVFIDLYNISNRSHILWNQFPSQQFNFIAGFTYKL